jgi:hypothetical protein
MLTEIADCAQSYLGEAHHSLVNRTAISDSSSNTS